MPIYRKEELLKALSSLRRSPNKSLSQNFLVDGNIVRKIVDQAAINPGDQVLEIGPGLGTLTEEILQRGAHAFAIEKDEALATHLKATFSGAPLSLIIGDALFANFNELFGEKKIKLLSNIPYNITSDLLKHLINQKESLSIAILMMQKEVMQKVIASKKKGPVSLLGMQLQTFFSITHLFDVSPHCFHPKPKVISSVISLVPKERGLKDSEGLFALMKTCFQQKRKQIMASFFHGLDKKKAASLLSCCSLPINCRVDDLSIEDWISLYEALLQEGIDPGTSSE